MTTSLPTLLDIALSLVFVFFIVSVLVSGIWEFIGTILRDKRATLLRTGLQQMLADPAFATLLYDHPLIKGQIMERPRQWLEVVFSNILVRDINEGKVRSIPSYIAPTVFSRIVLGLLEQSAAPLAAPPVGAAVVPISALQQLRQRIDTLVDSTMDMSPEAKLKLQKILIALIQDASDVKGFVANVETWYVEYMNRLSGYYKQYSQEGIRGVAIVVVLVLNLDAANLTIRLYRDPVLRNATVSDALVFSKIMHDTLNQKSTSQALNEILIRRKFKAESVALSTQNLPQVADSLKKLEEVYKILIINNKQRADAVQDSLRTQLEYLMIDKGYLGQLPFGWTKLVADFKNSSDCWNKFLYLLTVLFGWVLTVTAVSFGAPFWFDLLLKIVNVRNVGKNPSDKT
jgi:hypothetical protein